MRRSRRGREAAGVQRERLLLVLSELPYRLAGFPDNEHTAILEINTSVHLPVTATAGDSLHSARVESCYDMVDTPVDALHPSVERHTRLMPIGFRSAGLVTEITPHPRWSPRSARPLEALSAPSAAPSRPPVVRAVRPSRAVRDSLESRGSARAIHVCVVPFSSSLPSWCHLSIDHDGGQASIYHVKNYSATLTRPSCFPTARSL